MIFAGVKRQWLASAELAAAAASSRNRVRRGPARGGRELVLGYAGQRPATASAFSAPEARIHTSRAAWMARNVKRDPGRRRLGGVADRDDGPSAYAAGDSGKIDATWPSGPMPSISTSKAGTAAVRRRGLRGGRGQLGRVPGGGRVRVVAVRAVRAGHRVHPGRVDVERGRAARRGRRSRSAPGRPVGHEPLVAPPEVHEPPVHRVPGGGGGDRGEHLGADAAAGQHQVRVPVRRRARRRAG